MLERSRRLRDLSARAMCQNFNVLRLASNQSNDTTPVRVVVWQIPPPGCYKLNTDGSRRKIDGQASCGGVDWVLQWIMVEIDCLDVVRRDWKVSFHHVLRSSNKVTNSLPKSSGLRISLLVSSSFLRLRFYSFYRQMSKAFLIFLL
ncbi:hypothetical protein V6N12_013880 [Hibiscus sabdariffa]|uniref:RNase H type-1 domain-containing protein n=1 Tax=Hibiscus sabdariffa TaxID=183260 RepID=A0ABR2AA68_9ROSI